MPPFMVHGVSDEERYVGQDGVQRPYGMVFQDNDGSVFGSRSSRKVAPETGSFGKSTRRSRSRTGTPAPKKQEDPTLAAANKIFEKFFNDKAEQRAAAPSRTSPSRLSASISQPNLSSNNPLSLSDGNGDAPQVHHRGEPTEVILRGFKKDQDYAAIYQYEKLAGTICEDYARDAPVEQRKYKGDNRDPAVMRRRTLTPEEKAKALKFAGGEHWIKITFESAEAAEMAIENSPQLIFGHYVYAELYRGQAPSDDGPIPADGNGGSQRQRTSHRSQGSIPRSQTLPAFGRSTYSLSPPASHSSSQTLDTATISHSSDTIHDSPVVDSNQFCNRIPTARRIKLLPAEQALLPQQSFNQRILSNIPIIGWLSSDIIGSQVPKNEEGEFDWAHASFYWRFVWWLDTITGWFDLKADKEE